MVCYIQKYVIILAGIFPLTSPQPKYRGGCVPGIPGGVDASDAKTIALLVGCGRVNIARNMCSICALD